MKIDELDESGIKLISIVDDPAIAVNYVKLSAEQEQIQLSASKEKQYVTGPILIPDQKIKRRADDGSKYYITASAEDIEAFRNKFMLKGELKKSNLDHSENDEIEGHLIESWIVVDAAKDKSAALGFKDVIPGTLFATYRFPDPKVWAEVSLRNGFSLEGIFKSVEAKLSMRSEDTVETLLEEILSVLESA